MNGTGNCEDISANSVPPKAAEGKWRSIETATERIDRLSIPEPMSGCWLWLGTATPNRRGVDYGRLSVQGRSVRAHRYSYEAHKGAIQPGLNICHSCDNPLCVNPDHLFAGTHQDNADDRERKGRSNILSGERHYRATITAEQASHVKWLLSAAHQ